MRSFFLKHNRHGKFFARERLLLFVYQIPTPESGDDLQLQPELSESSHVREALNNYEEIPDEELYPTGEAALKRAVSEMFHAQTQQEDLYAHKSGNPLLAKMPELDDGDAGALYLASETQEQVATALYGEENIAPEINDPNGEGMDKLPLMTRIETISTEEQTKQIIGLLQTEGINPSEHETNIQSALADGGSIVVEVGGVPVVCGKGISGDGNASDKIYFVAHDSAKSGFVHGGGGANGKNPAQEISSGSGQANSISLAKSPTKNGNDHNTYHSSTTQDLLPGISNVSNRKSLRIDYERLKNHGVQSAVMAASVAPLRSPHALRNREAKPSASNHDFHYSKAEQSVISSLMSDPAVTKKVIDIADGSPTFLKAALDLMSFRYGPHTEDALLIDDGDDRMKPLFAAIKTHFQETPRARSIAEHLWKTELVHMHPSAKNPEDKKLLSKLAQLHFEDCLNPEDWRDLASARRKKELPMIALYNHFPELRSEGKDKTTEA